jgi:hypothetical protein
MISINSKVLAQLNNCPEGIDTSRSTTCMSSLPEIGANESSLETLLMIVFGTITAVAVVVLVVQGIRFVLSQGEPEKTAQARKGVIYAAVGLVVVFMADVAVAFMLGRFF